MTNDLYRTLHEVHDRPEPFSIYTARDLWTDPHTSARMLAYHLDGSVDVSSRRAEFIERSAAWIGSRFGLGPQKAVVDFGCGPGLYTTRLARQGAQVTGLDFSPRSIEYARGVAREEGLSVEYVLGDYLEYETDRRIDLAMMIMCDFCALGPSQRAQLLGRFREILNPGGAMLLDVYSLAAFARREESAIFAPNLMDGFWSPDDYFGFLNTFKYEAEKVMLDKFTIVETARARTVYNWLQYFSPEALRREFEAAGLAVEAILGDVAGGPFGEDADEFAVIARKP